MTNRPLVSVITVTLNSESFIRECIASVLRQTYAPIEYIVVDGGSCDQTLAIVETFRRRFEGRLRLRVSKLEGISNAFNQGIRMACGELIGILNSDDRYDRLIVEKAVELIGDDGFIFGDTIYTDRDGDQLFRCMGDTDYGGKIRYRMPALNHPTIFVKSSVYRKCGVFDPQYLYAMDYELMLRFWLRGIRGRYSDEILAWQRLGGASDLHYRRAYKECRDISLRYGLSKFKAFRTYHYLVAKGWSRRASESVLHLHLAQKLRKWVNPSIRSAGS